MLSRLVMAVAIAAVVFMFPFSQINNIRGSQGAYSLSSLDSVPRYEGAPSPNGGRIFAQ